MILSIFRKAKQLKEENKKLRDNLTDTWRLMSRAKLIFGEDNNQEYYACWDIYWELEKTCEPFLNKWFTDEEYKRLAEKKNSSLSEIIYENKD